MFLTTVEIPDISVDIKSIKQMLDGFDPVSLLPSIDTLVGKVQLVCVIALLAGPLIMTGMGLVYLLFAPKEANWCADGADAADCHDPFRPCPHGYGVADGQVPAVAGGTDHSGHCRH